MSSANRGMILRILALVSLVGLLIFLFGFAGDNSARAAPGLQEDTPGYDWPTDPADGGDDGSGYDAPETETPFPTDEGGEYSETQTPLPDQPTAGPAVTVTGTSTEDPNIFLTEDAEMNDSLTTPPATETPGPTITPFPSPTLTKTPTRIAPIQAGKKKDGFSPDWGLFWIGFSIPVLGACGIVLYLLDRRPNLFRRGK